MYIFVIIKNIDENMEPKIKPINTIINLLGSDLFSGEYGGDITLNKYSGVEFAIISFQSVPE